MPYTARSFKSASYRSVGRVSSLKRNQGPMFCDAYSSSGGSTRAAVGIPEFPEPVVTGMKRKRRETKSRVRSV